MLSIPQSVCPITSGGARGALVSFPRSDFSQSSYRRRRSRRWLLGVIAVFVGVAAAWLAVSSRQSSPVRAVMSERPRLSSLTVRWNGPITPAASGIIVAKADGLFAREGLSVALEPGIRDDDVVQRVADNEDVIGQVSASAFLRSRANGLPIIAFASSYMVSSVELYALANTKLNSPDDLQGKSIGYDPGSDREIAVEALLRNKQVARSQIRISDHATVSDLLLGKIDVLAGRAEMEGDELRARKIPFKILSPDAFGIHSVGSVYIASERSIAHAPDMPQRFLAAVIAGWDALYEDRDRAVAIIQQQIDPNVAKTGVVNFLDRQRAYIRPFGARTGELDLNRWRELQDRMLAQRQMAKPVDLTTSIIFSLVPELYRTRVKALTSE